MGARQERLAGRFDLIRKVGEGGMGRVFEAEDSTTGERLAVKMLPQLDGERLYMFKREFRSLDDLEHPNLISLRELHSDGDTWFFTMEYVSGQDFRSFVRPGEGDQSGAATHSTVTVLTQPSDMRDDEDIVESDAVMHTTIDSSDRLAPGYDEDRLVDGLHQLIDALDVLHATGRIHRDIKPDNVLVTEKQRVVLLDFGLVTELESRHFPSITKKNQLVGTVAYMAPEQATSEEISPATDWYAVGVMLYEALTGELPYVGKPMQVLLRKQMESPTPPHELNPRISSELSDLAMDLLEAEPEDRPAVDEIRERLGAMDPGERVEHRSLGVTNRADDEVFVGRSGELDALHDAWASVERETVAAVVVGEAGLGKSVLAERFLDELHAEHDDLLALYGRCYESETVPFKAFDGIIDALSHALNRLDDIDVSMLLPHDLTALVRVFPVLGRVEAVERRVTEDIEVQNPREIRLKAFESLRDILLRIGREFDLVLYIDDLHWADADSLLLLQDLIDADDSPRMLLLATMRPFESGEERPIQFQLHNRNVRWIELGGLGASEVEELLDSLEHIGGFEARAIREWSWVDEAEGHPLLVEELVRFHAREGADADAMGSLEELLWARVQQLDETTQTFVEICSLAGVPLPLRTLQLAADVETDVATRAAQSARSAHLLRLTPRDDSTMVEPYHDRVREATTARLEADRRDELQKRMVGALRDTGMHRLEPLAFVECLVAAGRTKEAAREARRSADHASDALAFEKAAELYELARDLGDYDADEDRELQLRIADNLIYAGLGTEAADYLLEAAETADSDERFDLKRRAAEELVTQGDKKRGMAVLREVLAAVGESLPKRRFWLIILIVWHRFWIWVSGLDWEARPPEDIPDETLRKLEALAVVRRMALTDLLLYFYFQTRELRLALSCGSEPHIAMSLVSEGSNRAVSGTARGQERGRQLQARALELAEELDDPMTLHVVQATLGFADYSSCRFERARRTAEEQIAWFEAQPHTEQYILNTNRMVLTNTLRYLGDLHDARARYDEYLRDATYRGDEFMQVGLRWWCNYLFLVDDRPERAREVIEETEWTQSEAGSAQEEGNRAIAQLEIALYEGTFDEGCDQIYATFEAFIGTPQAKSVAVIRTFLQWLQGRFLLARGGPGEVSAGDRKTIERLIDSLDDEDITMFGMYARLLEGALSMHDGDRSAATRNLREAVRIGEDYGVRLYTECARLKLSELLDGEVSQQQREKAMEYMAAEGVVAPARLLGVYTPGYEDRETA